MQDLKPCPSCGKRAGKVDSTRGTRFAFWAQCQVCGFTTPPVRIAGVAVTLWDKAKKARAQRDA